MKFLKIGLVVVLLLVAAGWAFSAYQSKANDDALASIKSNPAVIVLEVSGMT